MTTVALHEEAKQVQMRAKDRMLALAAEVEAQADLLRRKAQNLRDGIVPHSLVYGSTIGSFDGELAAIKEMGATIGMLEHFARQEG